MSLTQVDNGLEFGPELSRGISKVVSHIHDLDLELQERFADFFSFMLSQTNFDYDWPSLEAIQNEQGVKEFLQLVFMKGQRVTKSKEINLIIPQEWREIMLNQDQKPSFLYAGNP